PPRRLPWIVTFIPAAARIGAKEPIRGCGMVVGLLGGLTVNIVGVCTVPADVVTVIGPGPVDTSPGTRTWMCVPVGLMTTARAANGTPLNQTRAAPRTGP